MAYEMQCLASLSQGAIVEIMLPCKKIGVVAGFSIPKNSSVHNYKCNLYVEGRLFTLDPMTKVKYIGRQITNKNLGES